MPTRPPGSTHASAGLGRRARTSCSMGSVSRYVPPAPSAFHASTAAMSEASQSEPGTQSSSRKATRSPVARRRPSFRAHEAPRRSSSTTTTISSGGRVCPTSAARVCSRLVRPRVGMMTDTTCPSGKRSPVWRIARRAGMPPKDAGRRLRRSLRWTTGSSNRAGPPASGAAGRWRGQARTGRLDCGMPLGLHALAPVLALGAAVLGNVPRGLSERDASVSETGIRSGAARGDSAGQPRSLQVNGEPRRYFLYIPSSWHRDRPAALVLVFHGGGGRASGIAPHTGFSRLADREGFVVAYPEGLAGRWNDGRGLAAATHDDVGFVRVLVDSLEAELGVDPRRVYATGISNGAMFSYRLACDLPGTFAAVAPVAGAMPAALADGCAHTAPVSVLAFQGTADPLMPYGGGGVAPRRGQVLPAERSIAFWATVAGCSPDPSTTAQP